MQDIICKEGIRGMFKGWWLTLSREVPQFGIYFGTYAWIRLKFTSLTNTSPENFYFSLARGITAWGHNLVLVLSGPVDVIKSRFQNDGLI